MQMKEAAMIELTEQQLQALEPLKRGDVILIR